MTAADHPSGLRPVPPRPQPPASCPPDLDLARFVDGTLPDGERAGMIEHLADCDDCREIVVMAAGAPPLVGPETVVAPPVTGGDPRPPQRRVPVPVRRYGPWAAAAAGLAATVVVAIQLQRPAPPDAAGTAADPWHVVAQTIGATRHVEARLAHLPGHVPLVVPTRAATGPAVNFAASAVAARLAEEAAQAPADRRAAAGQAAGVAALVAGQAGSALKLLDEAVAAAPDSPELHSDLAAAHIAIASLGSRVHWTAALEASEAALRISPGLPAARFNRALALEGLGRTGDARDVWRALAANAADEQGWRDEAAAHLQRLSR